MDEPRRKRTALRIIEDLLIGMVIIVVGGACALMLAVIALLDGSEAAGLLVGGAATALGVYALFLGLSFVRGRGSFSGRAGLGAAGVVAVLVIIVALFSGQSEHDTDITTDTTWLTLSRNGRWAAFASDRASPGDEDEIYAARLGTPPRRVTHSTLHEAWPALSPDGSKIAFARFEENGTSRGLYLVNRDGSGLRRLTRHDDWAPSWSPDGRTIAFTRSEGFEGLDDNLYAVDVDGSIVRALVRDAQNPAWSPDGSTIAFVRGLGTAIAVFDVKSRRITRVIGSTRVSASNPAWSPNGKRLAFVDMPRNARSSGLYDSDDFLEIYVVNIDGSGRQRLTRNTGIDSGPTWTPGGRIVFERYVGTKPSRFFVMNADGTGAHRFVIQREHAGS